jgi:DNA (cytosine-5)-methyltransferase 1
MIGVSCVDLFCGVGGLTHGLRKEGINVTAGIDVDDRCRYPYEINNNTKFVQADVGAISPKELALLFRPGDFKVLAGCAPCQPFSTYSQRYDLTGDPRWTLLDAFANHALAIQPDVVTMENVPSLQKHDVFHAFIEALGSAGYSVMSQVVDCSAYGVAQTRHRLVMLASRHGEINLVKGVAKKRSVRDVISALPRLSAGEKSAHDRLHVAATLSARNLERIRASRPGGSWRDWPPALRSECHKKKTGKTYPGVYGRMSWDEPAPTITTQCFGFGNGRFGHPEQDRAISLREAAMLQSFPRGYKFVGPGKSVEFRTVGRMIGNAVPVNLGRAIGKSIVAHLETKSAPKRRRSQLKKR